MSIESKKKTIDGVTYVCTQFGVKKALNIQRRIMNVVGPGLEKINGVEDIMGALGSLMDSLDESSESLVFEIISQISVGPDELSNDASIDKHLAGNISVIIDLVRFSLETNYGNFFTKLAGSLGGVLKRKTPNTKGG